MTTIRNKPVEELFRIRFQNNVGDSDSETIEKKVEGTVSSFDLAHINKYLGKIIDITPLRPGSGWKIYGCIHKAQFILQILEEHFSFDLHKELKVEEDNHELYDAINTLDSVIDQLNIAKEELQMHLSYTEVKENESN